MKLVPPIIPAILMTTILFGCLKSNDLSTATIENMTPEFAIPLVKDKIKIQDFFEGENGNFFLTSNPDGLISLNYKGKILTQTGESIIDEAVALFPGFIPLLDTITALPMTFNLLEIDKAQFRSGLLQLGFNLPQEDFHLELIIPGILNNGVPFSFSYDFHYTADSPDNIAFPPTDISDYFLQEDDDSLKIVYHATNNDGNTIHLDNFLIRLEDIDFSYLQGYLGNYQYDVPRDTIKIKFFENIEGGVYFQEPKIYINVLNSFGVPTRSLVNVFQFHSKDGVLLPLESTYIADGINFAYPSIEEIGVVKQTNFEFHKDNSNIADIIALSPIALEYDVDAITNPDTITTLKGFITDSSFYTINMEVQLPLYGFSELFTQYDTVELKIDSLEHVKSAELKLITENRFPIDFGFQAYFLDESNHILDSLLTGDTKVIKAAGVDADGQVTEKNTTTTMILLPENKIAHVLQAKNIVTKVQLNTKGSSETDFVKITLDQDLEIRMGLRAVLKK